MGEDKAKEGDTGGDTGGTDGNTDSTTVSKEEKKNENENENEKKENEETKEEINKKEQEGTSTTTDIPSQPKEEQLLAAQKEIEKVKAASATKTADAPLKTKSPPGKGKAARL